MLKTATFLCLMAASALTVLAQTYDDPAIKEKSAKIHASTFSLDTHADVPMLMVARPDFDISKEHDARRDRTKVDFPRMRKGGLDGIFFAVYVGQGPRTPEGNEEAKDKAKKQFDAIYNVLEKYGDQAGLATSPEEALALKAAGKLAIFIGVENGYTIGRDLSLLETYYNLGARYMTLSHSANNDICDSSTDRNGVEHRGLSDFGVEVVEEMNRLGMLVDVSHISDDAFYDCIKVSKAPIVATHSSARELFDHGRNLSDAMIKTLAAHGGVVQMNMLSGYLKASDPARSAAMRELRAKYAGELTAAQQEERTKAMEEFNRKFPEDPADLALVMDHIDHIVKLVGVDHVGIGPDFDGGGGVTNMFDVSEAGNVTYELVKRGYSEEDIEKIWSGNFFRVMKEAQAVAASLK